MFTKAYIQKVDNVTATKFLEIVKPIYLFYNLEFSLISFYHSGKTDFITWKYTG